jgi:hypothetical protein
VSILKTLEATAADLKSQMGPVADRMKDTADDLMEKIGTESRHFGGDDGQRLAAQLEQVPDEALKRVHLVTARKSRRRMILGLLLGLVIGAIIMAAIDRRRKNSGRLQTGGWDQEPTASGELPK